MSKKVDYGNCYKCGKPAVGLEHVPPKCIFPEAKDLGKDYRKNLIKIPSCAEHNQDKTEEDEFFMLTITPHVGNNFEGYLQTKTKVKRAFGKKKPDYFNTILENHKSVIIEDSDGDEHLFYTGKMDHERMDKYIELMVSGLFYHEYEQIFTGDILIIYDFLYTSETIAKDTSFFIRSKLNSEFESFEKKGANPEIFTYQFNKDADGFFVLKLCFFEGANIYVLLHPNNVDQEKVKQQNEVLEWEGLKALQEISMIVDLNERVTGLESYLKKFPPTTFYYSTKGITEYKLKNFTACEINLLYALKLDRRNIDALNGLAYLYHHILPDTTKAKHYYIRAIEAAPEYTNLRLNFAQFLSQKDNNQIGAKIQFEKILSYDLNDSRAHNNLANYYRRKNQTKFKGKIIFHLQEAIRLNPSYIEAYLNYGNFLQLNGEKEKSSAVFLKAKTLTDDVNIQKVLDHFTSKNK
jgi:Tfp pilus assembly protein PilF